MDLPFSCYTIDKGSIEFAYLAKLSFYVIPFIKFFSNPLQQKDVNLNTKKKILKTENTGKNHQLNLLNEE